jgi:hypothetical protein
MFNDTAPWVAELLIEKRREMSPAQKLALVDDLNLTLHYLALSDLRRRHPNDLHAQRRGLLERRFGREYATHLIDVAPHVTEQSMEPIALRTMLDCTVLLEQHGISYAVGGSVASSIYGEERGTRDVDILAQLDRKQAQRIFPQLESAFYIQYQDVVEAITRAPTLRDQPINRATFNMVHRETLYKVDVFVSSGRPFEVSQLRRTIRQVVSSDGAAAQVTSAEDTILAKLEWFEMSNRQFDRQWNDITMMFNVQQHLDLRYLRTWAGQLGVGALLEKAIAGESPYSPPDSSQRSMF